MICIFKLCAYLLLASAALDCLAQNFSFESDEAAYRAAIQALVPPKKIGVGGNSELVWSAALKHLALSKSSQSDVLLAQLALFRLDGAFAEEYSCAASKRDEQLSIQLRRRLRTFDAQNTCQVAAKQEGLSHTGFCASKTELERVVTIYQGLPMKDEEGACNY